ncbi:serine/threonine protein kinase, partial [Streptomyces fulvissimus]|nr:serine/threonine protein kinase [Streptomyces microflavus]
LLDLEPQDAPVGSGPVPFSSASLGAGFGAGTGARTDPDPHDGPGRDARSGDGSRTGSDARTGSDPGSRTGSGVPTGSEAGLIGVFGPPLVHVPDGPPGTPPPGDGHGGGFPGQRTHDPRFSVTVSADSQASTGRGAGADA